jgi:hypothetical protein
MDDYTVFLNDKSRIDKVIEIIRSELGKYELLLNESKIDIIDAPFIYGKPWIEEIMYFMHLSTKQFYNKLILLYNEHRDITIIRYGIKIVNYKLTNEECAELFPLLLNLWRRFPSLSDLFVTVIQENKSMEKHDELKEVLVAIGESAINLNYNDDLIWSMYAISKFKIKVDRSFIKNVLASGNDLAIILALSYIEQQEILPTGEEFAKYKIEIENLQNDLTAGYMTGNKDDDDKLLWSPRWLLAYEATVYNWFDITKKPFNYIADNPFFNFLKSHKISFFDNTANMKPFGETENSNIVTRKEFNEFMSMFAQLITSTKQADQDKAKTELINFMKKMQEAENLYKV